VSEEAQVSGKLGFTTGLAVGLLAGSRAGRGLYDRSAAAATAVVNDPRVRRGASTALHKAGSAGSSVAGAAARKVKHRNDSGDGDTKAGAAAGTGADAGAVSDGECHSGGFRALREGIAGIGHHIGHHDGHQRGSHEDDGRNGHHDGQHNGQDGGINSLNGGTRRQEAAGTSASGRRRYDSRDKPVSTPFMQAEPGDESDGPGSS
jgi:hypothetical protein